MTSNLPECCVGLRKPDLRLVVESVESVLLREIPGDSDDEIRCNGRLTKHQQEHHERECREHQADRTQAGRWPRGEQVSDKTERFQLLTLHFVFVCFCLEFFPVIYFTVLGETPENKQERRKWLLINFELN